jgi:transposase
MNSPTPSRFWSACPACRSGWWLDRGLSSHAFREHIWNLGARPAIPSKQNEAPLACPDWIYNNRNQVERLWARLKEWRAIATRYEKTASSFMGVLCLAAALDWLKP